MAPAPATMPRSLVCVACGGYPKPMNHHPLLVDKNPSPGAVKAALDLALNPQSASTLRKVVLEADEMGLRAYLVGGIPRDLLLGRSLADGLNDLDVVVEGDAPALARRLAACHGGQVVVHERFGTATWHGLDADVDLVTARREHYREPAALPTIEAADLDADLRRRDFSVNAIAISLNDGSSELILDPCAGRDDLRIGRIRALHQDSFVDDPTRSLRAARFSARLGFEIDVQTGAWIHAARSYLDQTTGARLAAEFSKTMVEPSPSRAITIMNHLGLLDAVSRGLTDLDLTDKVLEAVDRDVAAWPQENAARSRILPLQSKEEWRLLFWLAGHGDAGLIHAERLDLPHRQRAWIQHANASLLSLEQLGQVRSENVIDKEPPPWSPDETPAKDKPSDSDIEGRLEDISPAALLLAMTVAPMTLREWIRRFVYDIQPLPALLDGEDLRALGIPGGPGIGALLKKIRARQLDEGLATREAALAYTLEILADENGDEGDGGVAGASRTGNRPS